ncbi:hypothetical protein NMY22_g3646 [Coprinellus aureogranulatus]|nr:hypothetical protein NMY22_g3646 [Coprinellus aureogranulatus]
MPPKRKVNRSTAEASSEKAPPLSDISLPNTDTDPGANDDRSILPQVFVEEKENASPDRPSKHPEVEEKGEVAADTDPTATTPTHSVRDEHLMKATSERELTEPSLSGETVEASNESPNSADNCAIVAPTQSPESDESHELTEGKRKRGEVQEEHDTVPGEIESKKIRIEEETDEVPHIFESSLRDSLDDESPLETLEELLSREERASIETRVLRSGSTQHCPRTRGSRVRKKEPLTLDEVRPTPGFKTNAKTTTKVIKANEKRDPRSYCGVLPRYLYCVLCKAEWDLEELNRPDYDTELYDEHALTPEHLARLAEIGLAPPERIATSVPTPEELDTHGRIEGEDDTTESSRIIRNKSKKALDRVYKHKLCTFIEDDLVQCSVCKVDMLLNIDPLATDTRKWEDHIKTAAHKEKVRELSSETAVRSGRRKRGGKA